MRSRRWGIRQLPRLLVVLLVMLSVGGCAAGAQQIIPTEPPTEAPTATPTPTETPDPDATPTASPSPERRVPTGGPSPTPLFGPTVTPVPGEEATPTRALDPNAPRIEFFQSDGPVEPGGTVRLFWSTRNVSRAVIYQLDQEGQRERLWNVAPDGNQAVSTSTRDRGQLAFLLVAGPQEEQVQQRLSVSLACPIQWFFEPAPTECADDPAEETFLIEQRFERGRMLYVGVEDRVYALFNDGIEPAWVSFENRYDPAEDPESEADFVPPQGFYQPIARLGFVWRGNDTVRNRLGLGIEPEVEYDGLFQRATLFGGEDSLYVSSPDGSVLQIIGDGTSWQIITTN